MDQHRSRYQDVPQTGDFGYENRVEVFEENGRKLIRKIFSRSLRYHAEMEALLCLDGSRLAPILVESCDETLTLIRTWMPGKTLEQDMSLSTEMAVPVRQIVQCLKSLHSYQVSHWGNIGGQPFASWHDFLQARFMVRIQQAALAPMLNDRLNIWFQTRLERLTVGTVPILLHHDLKPANLVIGESGIQLIDFDQSKGGDIRSDLAKLKWRTFGHKNALWAEFLRIYFDGRDTDRHDRDIDFYLVQHCLGAIAYSMTHPSNAYKHHERSAREWIDRIVFSDT